MPIEIRELVIRAVVAEDAASPPASPSEKKEEVLADCLEEVARILKEREER